MSGEAAAYEGGAQAWEQGPSRLYDALAREIVDLYPDELTRQRVLDVGAGTGAVCKALIERGARPTGVDTATDMVEHMRARGIEAVMGDARALPFMNGLYDGAVAAFVLSHVEDPEAVLAEMRRVVRGRGGVVVAAFGSQPRNASKDAVESVAERFGYVHPSWYRTFKSEGEPRVDSAEKLQVLGRRARLEDVDVTERIADANISAPADIVASRLGMAHLAPFIKGLTPAKRTELISEALEAVAVDPQPLRPLVLVMRGRVPS